MLIFSIPDSGRVSIKIGLKFLGAIMIEPSVVLLSDERTRVELLLLFSSCSVFIYLSTSF